MRKSETIRASKEFRDVINFIKAKHIMEGKIPPKTSDITKIIALKTDKEELLREIFIKI